MTNSGGLLSERIKFLDIRDANNQPYNSLSEFIEWIDSSTGNFNQGGAAPPDGNAKRYKHTQSTPANEWAINHGLGFYPNVSCIDSAGTVVYGDILHISPNTTVLSFSAAFSGTAVMS
jgi:hypothetical protein